MDVPSILNVLNEQKQVRVEVREGTKKLSKLNKLVNSLSSAYPELFNEAMAAFNPDHGSSWSKPRILDDLTNGWD